MRIKRKIIMFAILLLVPLIKVNAASGLIDISASNKNITVGNTTNVTVTCSSATALGTCEFTINYDTSKLSLVSGQESVVDFVSNNSTYKISRSYTFKAKASGSSTVSVKAYGMVDFNENTMSVSVSPVTITASSATANGTTTGNSSSNNNNNNSGNVTYSTNNYLESLSVEGYDISPKFSKDTLEYSLKLDDTVEQIKINAVVEDDKANLRGAGEVKVDLGNNKFEIVVTSEKGTTRTYIINVKAEDNNPIKLTIDNQKYTVVKRKSLLEKLDNYEEKTVTINSQEIPALYNKKTKITLVGLKNDATNKIELFIYDGKDYTKFNEIKVGNTTYTILNNGKYKGYKAVKITINDNQIEVYKKDESSKFSLVYAINNETGKKSWYKYDEEEHTLQRYEENNDSVNKTTNDTVKLMVLILGIVSLVFALLFIISLIISAKNKSKLKVKDKKNKDKKKE